MRPKESNLKSHRCEVWEWHSPVWYNSECITYCRGDRVKEVDVLCYRDYTREGKRVTTHSLLLQGVKLPQKTSAQGEQKTLGACTSSKICTSPLPPSSHPPSLFPSFLFLFPSLTLFLPPFPSTHVLSLDRAAKVCWLGEEREEQAGSKDGQP